MAATVAFLAGPDGRHVTGATVNVDGDRGEHEARAEPRDRDMPGR